MKNLNRETINPWLASQIKITEALLAKKLVVKFVRANMMFDWLTSNFNIRPPALVIRHPCAIISSQLSKGWAPDLHVLLNNPYFKKHPEIRLKCATLTKPEELGALAWCMRYHAPLSMAKPYPFHLVCYERLVRDGKVELEKLFTAWELPTPQAAINQLNIASDTVTASSQIVRGKDPLAGWKTILNAEQIINILQVLNLFEMTFYNEALESDDNATL